MTSDVFILEGYYIDLPTKMTVTTDELISGGSQYNAPPAVALASPMFDLQGRHRRSSVKIITRV